MGAFHLLYLLLFLRFRTCFAAPDAAEQGAPPDCGQALGVGEYLPREIHAIVPREKQT